MLALYKLVGDQQPEIPKVHWVDGKSARGRGNRTPRRLQGGNEPVSNNAKRG
jgi:hypothetical protein